MFRGVSLWGGLISGAMAQLQDTQAIASGHMNKKEYAIQTSKNVTGSLGIMAGIEYGAILGSSIFPGAGTIIWSLNWQYGWESDWKLCWLSSWPNCIR